VSAAAYLHDWDWRWRAPFDTAVDAQVVSAVEHLQRAGFPRHAATLEDLRAHAHEVASVGGLLAALDEEDNAARRAAMLTRAESTELNGVPQFIVDTITRRIDARQASSQESEVLRTLLARAARTSWRDPHEGALEIVFGAELKNLLTFGSRLRESAPSPRPLGRALGSSSVPPLVESFRANHSELSPWLGRFATTVVPGNGFAAYWPKELCGTDRDELRIEANADSLRSDVFQETLAHELGGHGVFYELLRRRSPGFVDHGALALVEGWATFAEWRLPGLPGPDRARLAWLDMLGAGEAQLLSTVPSLVRAQGYSESQAETALLNWTQLPAYQASYLLGGLWFAARAETFQDGLELLRHICLQPVGDFLRLY
jgi:hypothetical protein